MCTDQFDFQKMASRTRGRSRTLPLHLLEPLQTLSKTGRSFVELYEARKERMQAIVSELGQKSDKVKEMQLKLNSTRIFGAALGGLGFAVGVAAALMSSAGERAAQLLALGCTAAFTGGATVVTSNVFKANVENVVIKTVESLGKEFMEIVEPLKDALRAIKTVSSELDERSSSLTTTTGVQAKTSLNKTKQLEQLLVQTGKLAKRSREVMDVILTMQRGVGELLNLITRITPTTAEDEQLSDCITGSASQCKKTLTEFEKMRRLLKDFEEMQME